MTMSVKKFFVQDWWETKVQQGTQLLSPGDDDFRRGGDGDGMWFRTVSIQALYHDFQSYLKDHAKFSRLDGSISDNGFMMILREVMPPGSFETKYVRAPGRRIRCIKFRDREYYADKLAHEAA